MVDERSIHNNNNNNNSNKSSSTMGVAVSPLLKQQVANFSNRADDGDTNIDGFEKESTDVDAVSTNNTNSKAIPTASYSTTMSPYERMVMDLFQSNIDNTVGSNTKVNDDDIAADDDAFTIDPYWMEPLLSLTKSSARSLVRQLQSSHCPMGYDPTASPVNSILSKNSVNNKGSTPVKRTTSLLSYIRHQKSSYFKDAIVLVRVGDFYETYGIDAIFLVEYCGLNPMGGKVRAGCPWRNVQATLDGLTNAGLRVAVYEEWNGVGVMPGSNGNAADDDKTKGGSSKKLKTRYLAQVVSSANPTYMHGLVLNDDGSGVTDDAPSHHGGSNDLSSSSPGRSYVGVIETRAGYTLVEVSAEERTAVVSERLTAEAVSCRLVAYPPADPLFYVPPYSEEVSETTTGGKKKRRLDRLPFLPWRQQQQHQSSSSSLLVGTRGYSRGGDFGGGGTVMGRKVRVKTLPPALVVGPKPGLTDVERAKQTVVEAFLRLEDDHHSMLSRSSSSQEEEGGDRSVSSSNAVTHDDFVIVASSPSTGYDSDTGNPSNSITTKTHPLHLETATQLGLLSDPAIPPLISSLLPDSAPSASRRFLRRWLLVPPPPEIADAMSQLVGTLKNDDDRALPISSVNAPPLTGKVIGLIRAGQASAAVYREILMALDAACEVLLLDDGIVGISPQHTGTMEDESKSRIVAPLMDILRHDTGITDSSNDSTALRKCFLDTMEIIGRVVSTHNLEQHSLRNIERDSHHSERRDYVSYHGDVVPPAFFERNEAIWRGRVRPDALECARSVPMAARKLAEAVAVDFWGTIDDYGSTAPKYDVDSDEIIDLSNANESKNPVVQDIFNNLIAIRSIPSWSKESKEKAIETLSNDKKPEKTTTKTTAYFHPRDRNGKILRNRYTTERVQEAMSEYVEACADARSEVERVLTKLAWNIVDGGHLPAILQASHLNLILSTAAHHAASSNARGWSTGTIFDENDDVDDHFGLVNGMKVSSAGHFDGIWPYWMDRSESIPNNFDLDGLFLLTAPNMSGKSTLMRSTAAAALLINSGLCAPVSSRGSAVRRFDSLFVRGASADVPTEDKSAFGAEMGDVSALLRSCGRRSLVFVDEIGRGTSPKDGTSLAGAILERMAECEMSGMFATHLHGILELPFSSKAEGRLRKKRMAIERDDESGQLKWTYTLEDGVCTNSLALLTAAKFGLPESILKRAEELSECWDSNDHPNEKPAGVNHSNDVDHSSCVHSIQHAITILEETVGTSSSGSIQIPPSYMSPPSLEGTSCVYILQIGDGQEGTDKKPRYYVGETDSLSRRLTKHRSKGKDWSSSMAVAIRVESKSHARNVESLVIQRMAKHGFHLVSVTDGMSVRRSPERTE